MNDPPGRRSSHPLELCSRRRCSSIAEGEIRQGDGRPKSRYPRHGRILPLRSIRRRTGIPVGLGWRAHVCRHPSPQETRDIRRIHRNGRGHAGAQLHDGWIPAGGSDPLAYQQPPGESSARPRDEREPDVIRPGDDLLRSGGALERLSPVVTGRAGDRHLRGGHPLPAEPVALVCRNGAESSVISHAIPAEGFIRRAHPTGSNGGADVPQPGCGQSRNSPVAHPPKGNHHLRWVSIIKRSSSPSSHINFNSFFS